MRPVRLAAAALLVLSLAACSSAGQQPGWTYAPAESASAAPAESAGAGGSAAPSESAAPSAGLPSSSPSAGESGAPGATVLDLVAHNITYDKTELEAPANAAFQIHFKNEDASIPHDVAIRTSDGNELFKGDLLNDVGEITYNVPALQAGTYTFICTVHPIPQMTGTLTVK